ncbi:MAG TPA: alpha/beta hydrolase, partial [Leptospiraceae bacterium]|nr:alpha/beta hydrolase [Leptospiraceae bacterium]
GKNEEEHQRIQREKISSIECPVLILWGSHDGIFPEKIAHQFKEQIPHATLQVVDETGHLPHMEKPKEVQEILMNFYENRQNPKN